MNQSSAYLRGWLLGQPRVNRALDYGCGKLRYAVYLARRADYLAIVDSDIQLDHKQLIGGRNVSIREYVAHRWKHVRPYSVEEFVQRKETFDFALCANVLSTIPRIGFRRRAVALIASRLTKEGKCLFTVQYRNSYFDRWETAPNAKRYGDGWLVVNDGKASFYGIIPPRALERHVRASGMTIVESWVEGQSAYVLATRKNGGETPG